MSFLRKLLTVVSALSIILNFSLAESKLSTSITREQVAIEVSGSVNTGSYINLDFRPYWESRDHTTGSEVLSLWVALPDRGEPFTEVRSQALSDQASELQDCVELGQPAILRGVRIAPLTVRPCIQNGQEWEKVDELTLQIKTSGSGVNEVFQDRPSRSFDSIINSFVINPPTSLGTDEFDQEHLLIVCPDFAEEVLTPFVEWKRRKGLEVTLSTLSEIGITADDYIGLKAYIQEAYDTWLNPPDFVLLAGDETVLPVRWDYTEDPITIYSYGSVPGLYVDENYFACLEGDDFFPDILLGRWPIPISEGEYPYVYLSAKIMRYEMDPNLYNTEWYQHSVVTGQDENYPYQPEPSQRLTKLYTRDIMLNYGFTEVDTLFGEGTGTFLTQWINDGRSYLNYRGAGWAEGWAGITFYIDQVLQLQNSFMLPVVTGIGCGVGLFGDPNTCFGEFWMWVVGTMTNHRGAICFIGPGWNTHTMFNDSLDIGLYRSIFEDGEPRIAASLVAGKMFMYNAFDDSIILDPEIEEILRVAFNQYYVLSDPELMPYNAIPTQLQTSIPSALPIGNMQLDFTINDEGGQPFEGALVCLYHPTDFQSADITGPNGTVTLDWNAITESSFAYFTVTAHNHAAIIDSIAVIGYDPYVLHYDLELDDSAGGNGDGSISPGEEVNWIESVRNWGLGDAYDVSATLTTLSPTVFITQDSTSFGNVPAESTAVGMTNYEISVSSANYTIGEPLEFEIDIRDAMDSSWTSTVELPLITPVLTFIYAAPDVWVNGIIDRGDTCEIHIGVENTGFEDVLDGTLELYSTSPYIEIIDGIIPLSSFTAGQMYLSFYASPRDSFIVCSSPYTPMDYEAQFYIKITSEQPTYSYADSIAFTLPIGVYYQNDPTFDSLGIYYAYESLDTIYLECPTFEWFEIDPDSGGPGNVLEFTPELQTQVIDLPFIFRYWGEEFTRLTISADGWIMPGETTAIEPENQHLPWNDNIPGMIAALWDSLWNPTSETGQISRYYSEEQGLFYIEYNGISHNLSPYIKETFQIVLLDPLVEPTATGDGEILFYYRDLHMWGIQNSTVGIESPDQLSAIEYSYNYTTPITAYGLSDSLAIRWTTDPPIIPGALPVIQPVTVDRIPDKFTFNQPYPNPFNPVTMLNFSLPSLGKVELNIFNLEGQKVAELYNGNLNAGWYRFEFDGSNLGSGMYFARLYYKNQATVRKLILIK